MFKFIVFVNNTSNISGISIVCGLISINFNRVMCFSVSDANANLSFIS